MISTGLGTQFRPFRAEVCHLTGFPNHADEAEQNYIKRFGASPLQLKISMNNNGSGLIALQCGAPLVPGSGSINDRTGAAAPKPYDRSCAPGVCADARAGNVQDFPKECWERVVAVKKLGPNHLINTRKMNW